MSKNHLFHAFPMRKGRSKKLFKSIVSKKTVLNSAPLPILRKFAERTHIIRMIKIIQLILLLLLPIATFAQTAAALEQQAKATDDKVQKLNLLYRSAEKYMSADPAKASEVAHAAARLAEELDNKVVQAQANILNADGFERRKDLKGARLRYKDALKTATELGDKDLSTKILTKLSSLAKRMGNSGEAAAYAQQSADLKGDTKSTAGTTASTTGTATTAGTPTAGVKAGTAATVVRPTPTSAAEMNKMRADFKREKEALEADRAKLNEEITAMQKQQSELSSTVGNLKQKEKELVQENNEVKQTASAKDAQLQNVTQLKNKAENVAATQMRLAKILEEENGLSKLALEQVERDNELKLEQASNFRNILLLILGFALVLVALIFKRYLENKKQKKALQEKNKLIEDEKQRSEELLLNILPAPIALELKNTGKAQPKRHEHASVMFTDFNNFTKISEQLSPEQLVFELDTYFKAFDFIVSQYKLEKIKTIGDAYMCASGLSDKIATPIPIIKAALEIQQYLNEVKVEKMRNNQPFFEAKIGIHTGPVVAGVVGVNKFAYDIWGDTVNIAARLQDKCEAGKLNVSEATYELIKYDFKTIHRGKIPAKNKGMIDMYYVEEPI
jgi:class 3 adenylate cyclase